MDYSSRPTRALVDLQQLRQNFRTLAKMTPGTQIIAAVKGDGYGNGIVEVGKTLSEEGALKLAVALPEEGVTLREGGVSADILVLGSSEPQQMELSIQYELEQTVCSVNDISNLSTIARRMGKKCKIQLKLDTGMNRMGAKGENDIRQLVHAAAASDNLEVTGFFTHFYNSYEDREATLRQFELFLKYSEIVKAVFPNVLMHCANTAAALAIPETRLSCIRIGISLYGYNPSMNPDVEITPVLSLVSRIIQTKPVAKGEKVSYMGAWTAERDSRIAVLPLGYTDFFMLCGIPYMEVLIHGKRCPKAGAVCMDYLMVDITDVPEAAEGDEVVILGEQNGDRISLMNYSSWTAQKVSIGGVVSVGSRVQRIYKDSR